MEERVIDTEIYWAKEDSSRYYLVIDNWDIAHNYDAQSENDVDGVIIWNVVEDEDDSIESIGQSSGVIIIRAIIIGIRFIRIIIKKKSN